MYWQVYLHKTAVSAEHLLTQILRRAKTLANNKNELFCTPFFKDFIYNSLENKFLTILDIKKLIKENNKDFENLSN